MDFNKKFFPSLLFLCCCFLFAFPANAQDCKVDLGECEVEFSTDLAFQPGCIAPNVVYIPADFKCLKENGKLKDAITCALKTASCTGKEGNYVIDAYLNVIAVPSKPEKAKLDFLTNEQKAATTALAGIKGFTGQESCGISAIPPEGNPFSWVVQYLPPTDAEETTETRNSIPNPPTDGVPGVCEENCNNNNWTVKPSEQGGKAGFYLQNDVSYETALCYTPELGLRVLPKGKLTDDNREMALWHVQIASVEGEDEKRKIAYRITPKAYPRKYVVAIMDTGELVVQEDNMEEASTTLEDAVDDDRASVTMKKTMARFSLNTCSTDKEGDDEKPTEKPTNGTDRN